MKIKDISYEIPEIEVHLGEETILVKTYLPAIDKSNMMIALQEYCFNENIIDQAKKDALFNALLVLNYTNIEFEFKHEYELMEFYDYMEVNNYISSIIDSIPEIEYNALIGYYKNTINDFDRFKSSNVALFANIVEFGPELMEKIGEASKEIDIDSLTKLVSLVDSIG